MGRNSKLFQKRRAASEESLKRRVALRQTNKRVLIVCEGEKTELIYLNAFACSLRLVSVDIEICGDSGSAPISVVNYAEKRVRAEGSADDAGYDAVFCVFDRDAHETFEAAKSKIAKLTKEKVFPAEPTVAIISVPSFEYWFLIHFKFNRSPYIAVGAKSAGDRVIEHLKNCEGCSGYEKRLSKDMLETLLSKTVVAVANAKKSIVDYQATGEINPSTNVYEIIEYLESLKS